MKERSIITLKRIPCAITFKLAYFFGFLWDITASTSLCCEKLGEFSALFSVALLQHKPSILCFFTQNCVFCVIFWICGISIQKIYLDDPCLINISISLFTLIYTIFFVHHFLGICFLTTQVADPRPQELDAHFHILSFPSWGNQHDSARLCHSTWTSPRVSSNTPMVVSIFIYFFVFWCCLLFSIATHEWIWSPRTAL